MPEPVKMHRINARPKNELKTLLDQTRKQLDQIERFIDKPGNYRLRGNASRAVARRATNDAAKTLLDISSEL